MGFRSAAGEGGVVVGSLHFQQMTCLNGPGPRDCSDLPCCPRLRAAGWAVGFGMGYRRGVNDSIAADIFKAEHRINAE
jgi:hypothetical protein